MRSMKFTLNVGADIGNVNTKVVHTFKSDPIIYPTLHGLHRGSTPPAQLGGSLAHGYFDDRRRSWMLFGHTAENAVRSPNTIRYMNKYFDPDYYGHVHAAMLQVMRERGVGVANINITLGVPLVSDDERLRMEEQARNVLMNRTVELKAEEGEYTLHYNNVSVLFEPFGTLYRLVYTDDMERVGDYLDIFAERSILVIDVGGGTTDLSLIRNLQYNPGYSGTMDFGFIQSMEQFRALVRSQLPQLLHLYETRVIEAMNSGIIEDFQSGEILDVSADTQQVLGDLWYDIMSFIQSSALDPSQLAKIVLTGGGSDLLVPFAKEAFPGEERVLTPMSPLTANSAGFYINTINSFAE